MLLSRAIGLQKISAMMTPNEKPQEAHAKAAAHLEVTGKLQENGGGIGMSVEVLLLWKTHLVCIDVFQYD